MLSAAALRRGTTTSIRIPRAPPLRSYTRPHLPSSSPPLRRNYSQKTKYDDSPHSFFSKLGSSMRNTKIEWFHIPIGLGIAAVGFTQIRKRHSASSNDPSSHGPLPERAVRPMGAWQVQVLSTLPLKALSYYWGRFNEIQLPVFLRAPGFKLYSFFFGVNLDEVAEPLPHYRNLAEFFYRQLKPGVRPIDPRHNSIISPADGKVLQFGEVRAGGHVEQVKGMTYSLDSFLGIETHPNPDAVVHAILTPDDKIHAPAHERPEGDSDSGSPVISTTDEEFANVNGIAYTLPSLLSGTAKASLSKPHDASTSPVDGATTEVAKDLVTSWWSPKKRLFYVVVYLAPGDYHRFHSPVPWVVERRRHFNGELYSVSPLFQNRMPGLFTLNERVALLGRWRHGLFSMTLVGATNVGSIKIHFDRELRTNSFTKPVGDEEEGGFAEATYKGASALLGGHPLTKGAEVGGFNLGSTVVLVFEAPGEGKDAFKWTVKRGQTVKFGEVLGLVGCDEE